MPWASKAQAAWGHSPDGLVALGGLEKVKEWDSSTKKGSLPTKVKHPGALTRVRRKLQQK